MQEKFCPAHLLFFKNFYSIYKKEILLTVFDNFFLSLFLTLSVTNC